MSRSFYKPEDEQWVRSLISHTGIIYASMEIALHPDVHTYSGGLGILAGDILAGVGGRHQGQFLHLLVIGAEVDPYQIDVDADRLQVGRLLVQWRRQRRRHGAWPDRQVHARPADCRQVPARGAPGDMRLFGGLRLAAADR